MTFAFARRACTLILLALAAITLAAMAWPALAAAATGATSPADAPLLELARLIYAGVTSGQLSYWGAAAGALVLVTRVLRQYGAHLVPWLGGDAGGTVLVFGASLGGALLTAALGGASPSLALAATAFLVGATSAGGYATVRRLVIHPLSSRAATWPAPLRALYWLATWAFDRPEPGSPSSRAVTAPVALVLLLALSSCTGAQRSVVRHAGATGVDAGLVCQASSLTGLAGEAYQLARSYLWSRISGDGEVDIEAIRAAAREVKSDAGRCAFAAAMASLADLLSQRRGALAVSPSPAQQLQRAFAEIQQFEWQVRVTIKTSETSEKP